MKRDIMVCKRILLQIIQTGHFVSETPEDAYHVALLADRQYVEAKIERDDFGTPIKATVGRLTAAGHDAYESEFAIPAPPPSTSSFIETYYKILVNNKHGNDLARDKMLATIATGGIGLLFGIASYLKTNEKDFQLIPWFFTLTLWGLVLIGLMISAHLQAKAIDKAISQLGNTSTGVMHHYTLWDIIPIWLNHLNCASAILGIATFAWFLRTIV
jgi:hypothetical protein